MAFAYDKKSALLETNIRTALVEAFHKSKSSITDQILLEDLEKVLATNAVKKVGFRSWYYALMDYGAALKVKGISHNTRLAGYRKQTVYKGSLRELRAKVLFAITHREALPKDTRTKEVLTSLYEEGFIIKRKNIWSIA